MTYKYKPRTGVTQWWPQPLEQHNCPGGHCPFIPHSSAQTPTVPGGREGQVPSSKIKSQRFQKW